MYFILYIQRKKDKNIKAFNSSLKIKMYMTKQKNIYIHLCFCDFNYIVFVPNNEPLTLMKSLRIIRHWLNPH